MDKGLLLEFIKGVPYYENLDCYVNDNFEHWPILEKNTVRNNQGSFIKGEKLKNEKILTSMTSGSSGLPLNTYWIQSDYYKSFLEIWRMRSHLGILPSDKFCSSHVFFNIYGKLSFNKIIINNNNISLSKCYSDIDTYIYYYNALMEFSPRWMLVQPGFLHTFILGLHNLGLILPNSVKYIELTGEYCNEELLNWFKNLYPNIVWKIVYGMQEFNAIGWGDDNVLSVFKDNVLVEIADENNVIVGSSNVVGNIIVTGLSNSLMPLIRYKTGDKGYFNDSGNLVLIQARSNDSICFGDTEYDGSVFFALIIKLNSKFDDPIKQFQIHFKDGILRFLFVLTKAVNLELLKAYIENYLLEMYDNNYAVDICAVNNIEPVSTKNKIKYFINWDSML